MRNLSKLGIKVLFNIIGAYLLFAIIITLVQLFNDFRNVENTTLRELKNTSESFYMTLVDATWKLDRDSIESIAAGIHENESIFGVSIIESARGAKFSVGTDLGNIDYSRIIDNEESIWEYGIKEEPSTSEHFYVFTRQIRKSSMGKETIIGSLILYVPSNIISNIFFQNAFDIIIYAILKSAALWVIIVLVIKKRLATPLLSMANISKNIGMQTKELEKNNLQLETLKKDHGNNELGELLNALSFLNNEINEKIELLESMNNYSIQLNAADTLQRLCELTNNCMRLFTTKAFGLVVSDETFVDIYYQNNNIPTLAINKLISTTTNTSSNLVNSNIIEDVEYSVFVIHVPRKNEKNILLSFVFLGEINLTESNRILLIKLTRTILEGSIKEIDHNQEIARLNKSLEIKVSERTKELSELNLKLIHNSLHDPLTSLTNRTLYFDRLNQLELLSKRNSTPFVVVSIDLKGFKQINDTFGHLTGDEVLKVFSIRLNSSCREMDTVSRLGGDEFALLLVCDKHKEVNLQVIFRRIIDSIEKPMNIDGRNINVSCNIGYAICPKQAKTSKELFQMADENMYNAKKTGYQFIIEQEI